MIESKTPSTAHGMIPSSLSVPVCKVGKHFSWCACLSVLTMVCDLPDPVCPYLPMLSAVGYQKAISHSRKDGTVETIHGLLHQWGDLSLVQIRSARRVLQQLVCFDVNMATAKNSRPAYQRYRCTHPLCHSFRLVSEHWGGNLIVTKMLRYIRRPS